MAQGENQAVEEREQVEESQANEGYGCSCGFTTLDKNDFKRHFFGVVKGEHSSLGRVNVQTGEVIMPPWIKRTPEEKQQSRYAKKDPRSAKGAERTPTKVTDSLADAQRIQVVPRVFTMDYTPIMRAGQQAATKLFGWREDMPLQNFVDTILHHFFADRGIILAGFIVTENATWYKPKESEEEEETDGS